MAEGRRTERIATTFTLEERKKIDRICWERGDVPLAVFLRSVVLDVLREHDRTQTTENDSDG